MENKNNIFSFHPTGSPQGSEARKKKKISWISEHTQKEGLVSGCPSSANQYFNLSPHHYLNSAPLAC